MKKIIITILLLVLSPLTLASPEVVLEPVPDQGIQPVLERDAEGGIHLLYFSRVKEGSGYYLYRQRTDSGWSEAKRVNPEPVRASDVIGRADMAVGMNGKVHVTYFSGDYFYSQLDPASNTFSRPRKVATKLLEGIEAGAAVSVQGLLFQCRGRRWPLSGMRAICGMNPVDRWSEFFPKMMAGALVKHWPSVISLWVPVPVVV